VGLQARVSRASPGVWIVVDRSVPVSPNLATGANREGYHLTGVNYPRDFAATEILDFAMAPPGARCDQCGGRLVEERGFRIGSERLIPHRFAFAAADGRETMGDIASLRVRLDALFASVYRAARQASGVRFAPACAPFHVHLLSLPGGLDLDPVAQALDEAGLDVLLDDRNAPAGEKFAEADWIGAPVRVTSGRKSAQQNGVEVRWGDGRAEVLAVEQAAQAVLAQVRAVM
jgi:prolyl-tRNA synthetase